MLDEPADEETGLLIDRCPPPWQSSDSLEQSRTGRACSLADRALTRQSGQDGVFSRP